MKKHPFLTESDNKTKEHNVDALNYLKFEVLPVLVHLSCRRRVPQTGWFMETEIRFSQFWKSTFRFWWGPSSRLQTATCSRIRTWWEEGASSAPSWTQFMRLHPPLDLITSQRLHLLIPPRWGLAFNTCVWGGTEFQFVTSFIVFYSSSQETVQGRD